MNTLSTALVPVLIVLPIFDWIATIILLRLTRYDHTSPFLTERAISAIILSIVTTAFALIFLNSQLGGTLFDNDTARLLGRVVTAILGAGPIVWLVAFWRAR